MLHFKRLKCSVFFLNYALKLDQLIESRYDLLF